MNTKKKIRYSNMDILKYLLKKRHLPLKLASKIYDSETHVLSFDECFKSAEIYKVVDEAVKYMRFSNLEINGDITESSYLSPIKRSTFDLQYPDNDFKTEDYNQLIR